MSSSAKSGPEPAPPAGLRRAEVAWLAVAVFVVSAGYGALLPVLPGWLLSVIPSASSTEVARHVGFLSGAYALGVLIGAPLWGFISDRAGRNVILMTGFSGYVASLAALLLPGGVGIRELYVLRGCAGFFVAAIVPLVSVIVAEGSTQAQRARRFAWLSSMSLLGFLVGPVTIAAAAWTRSWFGAGMLAAAPTADVVVLLTAVLAGATMIGLSRVLRTRDTAPKMAKLQADPSSGESLPLWALSAGVMFVLAAFELGILLQGQRNAGVTSREVALMFAECSLVMLAVNAFLFFTSILKPEAAHRLIGSGLLLAIAGLLVLSFLPIHGWIYLGVSLTAAGTGLVLPVVAYLAASASRTQLGVAMGGLAAAASLGQTLGSAGGGWLFGDSSQHGFGWLALPLAVMLVLLLFRRTLEKNMKSIGRHRQHRVTP
jgi:MFS family permease